MDIDEFLFKNCNKFGFNCGDDRVRFYPWTGVFRIASEIDECTAK